jgi:hypothetical protein
MHTTFTSQATAPQFTSTSTPISTMSSLKSMLKRYKAAPRNEESSKGPPEPTLTPKQQYLRNLWQENTTNPPPGASASASLLSPELPFPSVLASPQGLGLLFIIIDDLPHEWIWRCYIQLSQAQQQQRQQTHTPTEEHNPSIRVWIHAKFPDRVQRYTPLSIIYHLFYFYFYFHLCVFTFPSINYLINIRISLCVQSLGALALGELLSLRGVGLHRPHEDHGAAVTDGQLEK